MPRQKLHVFVDTYMMWRSKSSLYNSMISCGINYHTILIGGYVWFPLEILQAQALLSQMPQH